MAKIKIIACVVGVVILIAAGWIFKDWIDRGKEIDRQKTEIANVKEEVKFHEKAYDAANADYEREAAERKRIAAKLSAAEKAQKESETYHNWSSRIADPLSVMQLRAALKDARSDDAAGE